MILCNIMQVQNLNSRMIDPLAMNRCQVLCGRINFFLVYAFSDSNPQKFVTKYTYKHVK